MKFFAQKFKARANRACILNMQFAGKGLRFAVFMRQWRA